MLDKEKFLLQNEFIQWIKDEIELPEKTAKSYCSYVASINNSFSILYKGRETNLFEFLKQYIIKKDSDGAYNLIDKVFSELCREDIAKILGYAEKTIKNWKSGLAQYREFIFSYVESSVDQSEDEQEQQEDIVEVLFPQIKDSKSKFSFAKDPDLDKNFTFRLVTQDRYYDEIFYPIGFVKRLFKKRGEKQYFTEWIKSVINNIKVITLSGEIKLEELESLEIDENGEVWITTKKGTLKVMTPTSNAEYMVLKVNELRKISLDHETSLHTIMTQDRNNLPVFLLITKNLKNLIKGNCTQKKLRHTYKDLLADENFINSIDMEELKKELQYISSNTNIRLMDLSKNISKGKK